MLLMSDEQKNKSELETAPRKMAEAFSEDEILNLDDFDIEYENPDEEGLFQSEQKTTMVPELESTFENQKSTVEPSQASAVEPVFEDEKTTEFKPMGDEDKPKSYFHRTHIDGIHDHGKKINHTADFQNGKYKSVSKYERIHGAFVGQKKFVNKQPLAFQGTGKENQNEQGEGHFLLTGIEHVDKKSGKTKKEPQHIDVLLIKRSDGKFENPENGEVYGTCLSSETQSYCSRSEMSDAESVQDMDLSELKASYDPDSWNSSSGETDENDISRNVPPKIQKISELKKENSSLKQRIQTLTSASATPSPFESNSNASSNISSGINEISINDWFKNEEKHRQIKSHIKRTRQNLPIYLQKMEILQYIQNNQVVLVKGETGCGKTTQVPQFILEQCIGDGIGASTNILVTQPRRLSTMSVANRVANERGERIGEKFRQGSSVGFEHRFQSHKPRDKCSITFVTTGIVFQMLRTDPGLSNVSHIVIDEVHERDLETDVMLAVFKSIILNSQPQWKLIIMSASLDVAKFQKYFYNLPIVEVPGRLFEVQEIFLEDFVNDLGEMNDQKALQQHLQNNHMSYINLTAEYEAVYGHKKSQRILYIEKDDDIDLYPYVKLIKNIDLEEEPGAILVFLPGWEELSQLEDWLTNPEYPDSLGDHAKVILLHSHLSIAKQTKVFENAPDGQRKIILSTNIAETSVTIPDVKYVIDSGKINMKKYLPVQKASNLDKEWISKSSAVQRRGRAGRVQNGKVWRMYSRKKFDDDFTEFMDPEINRLPLEEIVLNIKALHLEAASDIRSFMDYLVEPPTKYMVDLALSNLMHYEAIDKFQSLTPLGQKMAKIPLHPQLSKMVIMSIIFKCLEPILNIATVLNDKDVFELKNKRESFKIHVAKQNFCQKSASDHLLYANLIRDWEAITANDGIAKNIPMEYDKIMRNNCLNERVLTEMIEVKAHLKAKLKNIHLLIEGEQSANVNSDNEELIKGVITSGLCPQIAKIQFAPYPFLKDIWMDNQFRIETKFYIAPKSVNKNLEESSEDAGPKYLSYFEIKGNRKGNIHVQDCTVVDLIHLEIFTPINPGINSKFTMADKKQIGEFINDFMNGETDNSRQELIIKLVCGFLKKRTRENIMTITGGNFMVPKNFISPSFSEINPVKTKANMKYKNQGVRNRKA